MDGEPSASAYVGVIRAMAPALGACVGIDEVARCTLDAARALPGVSRAAIALTRGGGRQLQFLSSDQDRLGASLRWCLIDAFDDVPLNRAVRTGVDVYLHRPEDIDRQFPVIAARQRSLGTESIAALVLATGSQPLGGLFLAFGEEQAFPSAQRALLVSFAAQVAQALQQDRLHHNQVANAEALQRRLLPGNLPSADGLTVCARYHPGRLNAEVGGDWYDVFELADGATGFAVGDVTGKGLEAAVFMSEVRTALRAYALQDSSPTVLLPQLERFVAARAGAAQLVTVVYGCISPDRERLTWAAAGHPPPLLVPSSGAPVLLDEALGPALGLGGGAWRGASVPLRPDDTVFVFTDGLVHGRQVDVFAGIDRLRESFAALPERRRKPRRLCTEARSSMSGVAGWDDVTMLAIGRVPEQGRSAVFALSNEPSAVRGARRFVTRELVAWGLDDDTVETATLCVSELVTNAVLHGGLAGEVVIELDAPTLTVVVTDQGGGEDVAQPDEDRQAAEMISGRGLTLVQALTTGWGSERTIDGTMVWFELETSAARSPSPRAGNSNGR